ncbi:MAG: hypothetical protein CMQ28_04000 [Gammaproteobacteria bacterium]|nr:hypothetical protein [Gammaproteobacteria bacterium]|tara:strand:- start:2174 stop:2743 length:570 start_codon:yes stop_codon:yes gene_type:complete
MAEPNATQAPSSKNILRATGAAFVVGIIILLTAILPAEFGIDPLGIGKLTGVIALSRAENPFEEKVEMHRTDYVEFELGPFQSVEYKYTMDLDAPMVFTWVADGEVYFDMHAEPAGIGEEGAESFEQGNDVSRTGSFHAPFTGIHGWFWENRGLGTVVVRLYASGFFVDSTVFRDGGDYSRVIDPIAQQ